MRFLFLLQIFFILAYATQEKYGLVLPSSFNASLYSVVHDYDGGVSAVGFYESFKKVPAQHKSYTDPFNYLNAYDTRDGVEMRLVKLNTLNHIVFQKSFYVTPFSKAVTVVKTPDNGYIIGGYTGSGKVCVLKLNASGTLLFQKVFGNRHYDRVTNIIALQDGGVLLVGSSMTRVTQTGSLYDSGLGGSDILLMRLSQNGEIVWQKKLGTAYNDSGISVTRAHDGTFMVLGKTVEGMHNKIVLIHVSRDGDILWYKNYFSSKYITPYALITLHDGNFLFSFDTKNGDNEDTINLAKFDENGDLLEHVKLATRYPAALFDIQEGMNGYIVGVGKITDESYQDADGLFMKLSSGLKLIEKKHYGGNYYDSLQKIVILPNGEYVAVGSSVLQASQVMNMWIVKLTSNGDVVTTLAKKSQLK
jgi:WD40 repeat protein